MEYKPRPLRWYPTSLAVLRAREAMDAAQERAVDVGALKYHRYPGAQEENLARLPTLLDDA
jgi:hypothetical protein